MEFLRFLILAVIIAFAAAQLPNFEDIANGLPGIPTMPGGSGGSTTAAPAERYNS